MRNVSTAMAAYLAGDVLTLSACMLIARKDGQVFGFTDRDAPITYNGQVYSAIGGFTASAMEANSNLSVANLEADALFEGPVTKADIQAGVWDHASVTIFLLNPSNLAAGQLTLTSGTLGQFQILNGKYKAELRSLAQMMQQGYGEFFSPTCRALFGDSRCNIAGGVPTFSGTVTAVSSNYQFTDASLTQTGPTVPFTDSMGHIVPTTGPWIIQAVPPGGGAFVGNTSVLNAQKQPMSLVGGSPSQGQYSVSPTGLYTFNVNDAGSEVFINFTYAMGYFAYGKVTWLTGNNAGASMEVKSFGSGNVTLAMPMGKAVQVGDTYTIAAGCDKQFGTCRDHWNNIVHFRGEPYTPGPDTILRVLV
ncbi:DUF2163 domain-containing protein [Paraburkholderia mimosarum]|uniref:DUF2163 domain-containing protein n=1 Tax=Paraburkholderia mimosarum TaxID=312026 RepID=UPI0039C20443